MIPCRTVPPITACLNARRHASNVPQEEPAKKAQSLIDSLPGSSLLSKTAILSGGASLAVWLIANEIYVVTEETVTMVATLGSFAGIYYYGKPYYVEWAQSHIDKQKALMNEATQNHKNAIQERLDGLQELSGIIDITKGLFEVSRVCRLFQPK